MKKLIIVLKILGYIFVAYSVMQWYETSASMAMTVNEVLHSAGLAAAGLKSGFTGLVLLLISEALSLRKCKKD
jgi:hypothetical protein